MLSIITSYLLQTGKCALPYIGVFNTEYKPAVSDIVNRQILPPAEEIVFTEEILPLTPGLVRYAAIKKNIPENDAAIQLDNFCKQWKEKIDRGEILRFETIGSLGINDESGNIIFSKENRYSFYNSVPANRVLHQNAEHEVLVGDTQTTSVEMSKYYSEEPVVEKRTWHVWALVLFVFALIMLLYSFYDRRFSPSSVGNRIHFTIKPAGETYFEVVNN